MRRTVVLLAAVLLLIAAPVAAQTAQSISIQGSALLAALGGDAFEADGITFDPGAGIEAQIRYNPSALSIGVGFQYTIHPVTVTGFEEIDVTIDFAGLFVEPRYVIFVGSERAAPYVAVRIMRLVSTLRINEAGVNFEESYDAWGVNFGGGLLLRATDRLNLDVGLTVGGITFVYDDPGLDNESGTSAVLRLGLALGL